MNTLQVTYDGFQHCTAQTAPQDKQVAMDYPYTGKGEELSPANLVGSGLAGCMLISMGTLALRDRIDIQGTRVDVDVQGPAQRIESIHLTFHMAQPYPEDVRTRLERAAGMCPIEHSFHPDTAIRVEYRYPD
jgi:uncharacterized OsmC-like protein